ncbi:MAG: cobalamin-independent methionine synthase II family protein [Planctomycetaceae bacterium]|nr:cobalamin-independent methionine synthase II family protein [Planctomycetales bacterium]MCB9923756.1 cobalamin-independent methionine synthase II family protein [Planctomycetaceae bacterium]
MIKTTVVGSYPVPTWLQVFSTRESLRDAMLAVIKTQELAGIDVVADGELYRWDVNHAETNGMIDFFVRPMDGVNSVLSTEQLAKWRSKPGNEFRAKPPGICVGPLSAGTLDLKSDYEMYRGLTTKPKKFTVTSPYMLAKMLADQHYNDLEALVMGLADVLKAQLAGIDADVIQVDEANVTGHADDGPIAAAGINRVLESVATKKAVHLCYGNYGGQTIQKGTYDKLVAFLNALDADHVVLEIARRPVEELAILKDVKQEIGLGIGVIDIKDNEVESPTLVAKRIEHAANELGINRIQYVHPDCGFWMLPRSVADGKMKALVQGRDLFARI